MTFRGAGEGREKSEGAPPACTLAQPRLLATPQNLSCLMQVSVSCKKEPLPEPENVFPPLSQSEKLKIKSKPSSGFGCHPAQPLAGSTAPTFHDFRTFPKLKQLQGEEGE